MPKECSPLCHVFIILTRHLRKQLSKGIKLGCGRLEMDWKIIINFYESMKEFDNLLIIHTMLV